MPPGDSKNTSVDVVNPPEQAASAEVFRHTLLDILEHEKKSKD